MNSNGDHKRSDEDQPWNQTFSGDRDEHGNLSRVKLRQQSHSHNMVTIILVTLIIVIALVSLVYGIAKQSAVGKSDHDQSTVTVSQQDNSKKKSSAAKSSVTKTSADKKRATSQPTRTKSATRKSVTPAKSAATTRQPARSSSPTVSSTRSSAASPATNTSSQSTQQPNTTNQTSTANGHEYATVQSGQGMYRVAVNNGLSTQELMRMNGLSSASQIHPGQKLRVK